LQKIAACSCLFPLVSSHSHFPARLLPAPFSLYRSAMVARADRDASFLELAACCSMSSSFCQLGSLPFLFSCHKHHFPLFSRPRHPSGAPKSYSTLFRFPLDFSFAFVFPSRARESPACRIRKEPKTEIVTLNDRCLSSLLRRHVIEYVLYLSFCDQPCRPRL